MDYILQEYIEKLKASIHETNRLTKDHLDFRGRVQVKVLISNFINKCDYYLSSLDYNGNGFKGLDSDLVYANSTNSKYLTNIDLNESNSLVGSQLESL